MFASCARGGDYSSYFPKQAEKGVPVLIQFGSEDCPPCSAMKPVIETLKAERSGSLHIEYVDAVRNRKMAEDFSVKGLPTQVLLDARGFERFRHAGYMSLAEIEARLPAVGIRKK